MPDVPPTDHLEIIMELGTLRDAAMQRGDDRAIAILRRAADALHESESAVRTLRERRERDRSRPSRPRKSKESSEIHGIRGAENLRSSSSSLLEDLKREPTTTPRASTAESVERPTAIDADVQQRFDLLSSAMGEHFAVADEFVRRRQYATWKGWLDEMLSVIGPGSQFLPADLARVCKDDAALERPIGSPRGLRSFLGNARIERLNPTTDSPQLPRPTSQQRALKALDGIQ